ncbi:MAG TPA: COX15/CtaA family protein [Terriglobia bacterium]|jgi:cytochrome c oxidase assembly protein subunit 15
MQDENVSLHRFALFTACCTAFLIFVGGLVTSTQSGLSVPDWPTSYGWNMFTFPFSKWVGGIFYEHSHRLVASTVGFFTVILTVWTWLKEKRAWVRWLSAAALGAVVLQGVFGGLTVIFLLPAWISTVHACLAQTFFCLVIAIAVVTSPQWKRGLPQVKPHAESIPLRTLCAMTTAAVYVQLIMGALMRHTNAGLAIPDFPLALGHLIPPFSSGKIIIHFAHRVGAVIVTAMMVWTFTRIARLYSDHSLLFRPALTMLVLVAVQLTLGAITIWTAKAVVPTTAHVLTGALILGTSFLLTLRAYAMSGAHADAIARSKDQMLIDRVPAWK